MNECTLHAGRMPPSERVSPTQEYAKPTTLKVEYDGEIPVAHQTWPTAAAAPPQAFFNCEFLPRVEASLAQRAVHVSGDVELSSPTVGSMERYIEEEVERAEEGAKTTASVPDGGRRRRRSRRAIKKEWEAYKAAERTEDLHKR